MDKLPSLLGLALRAGRLAVGEEPVGTACRAHKAYLLLLASDAAENSVRRAQRFCMEGTNAICLTVPLTKNELGQGIGRASCAMLAVTDVGFAASVAQRLAQADPEAFGAAYVSLAKKADRAQKRRAEKREKSPRAGKGSAPRGQKKQV